MVPKSSHLGDFFKSSRKKGHDGLPLLSVTLENGLIPRDTLERRTETNLSADEHLLVSAGDIAYNMMRVWQGALGLAHVDGLVSPAYVVLKPNQKIDSRFAEYYFKTSRMIYLFWAYSYGLTKDRLRLYFADFSRIPVSIPPIQEQKKIAQILSTWDQAITTTERLLDLARQQKKALMQQLLTGKKRFPGFEGEWLAGHLSDIAKIGKGKALSSKDLLEGDYPVIAGGKTSPYSHRDFTHENAITVSASGAYAGFVSYHPYKIWASDCSVVIAKKNTDTLFLFQLLTALQNKIYSLQSGGAQPHIYPKDLESLKVAIPPLEEQKKIAAVLTSTDQEIETLQSQLDGLKQEKKALMQVLLTGKRRVQLN